MCVIIHKPAGISIPESILASAYNRNHDGFGVMFPAADGKVHVHRVMPEKLDDVLRVWDLYKDKEFAAHFRMRTHGNTDKTQCHPYSVLLSKEDGVPDVFLMHNGVLQIFSDDDTKSDTWHFVNYILRPILLKNRAVLRKPEFVRMVEASIGNNNKLMVLDGDPANKDRWVIFNKRAGVERHGCWFSNTYAWVDPDTVNRATHYYPVGHYYNRGSDQTVSNVVNIRNRARETANAEKATGETFTELVGVYRKARGPGIMYRHTISEHSVFPEEINMFMSAAGLGHYKTISSLKNSNKLISVGLDDNGQITGFVIMSPIDRKFSGYNVVTGVRSYDMKVSLVPPGNSEADLVAHVHKNSIFRDVGAKTQEKVKPAVTQSTISTKFCSGSHNDTCPGMFNCRQCNNDGGAGVEQLRNVCDQELFMAYNPVTSTILDVDGHVYILTKEGLLYETSEKMKTKNDQTEEEEAKTILGGSIKDAVKALHGHVKEFFTEEDFQGGDEAAKAVNDDDAEGEREDFFIYGNPVSVSNIVTLDYADLLELIEDNPVGVADLLADLMDLGIIGIDEVVAGSV